jgi:teichoic acid transport system permease protein
LKFLTNLKKYLPYAKTTAWAELKSQVAESYLGWLWWILDPILFMLVYTFIVELIFGTTLENFPLYVFIGLIMWNFFSATVLSSVGIVRSYRSILLQTYLPKYILIFVQLIINLIKMVIGLIISFVIILILGIPLTFNILSLLPILIVYILFTFGVSLFFTHGGVFIADLQNITIVLTRLLFYLSGVFYSLASLPSVLRNIYSFVCPTGFLLAQCRNVMMYGMQADYPVLGYWLAFSIVLIIIGLRIMNKYENEYIKVV